ncbi:MAG: RluA family pseudouridine synthase [Myxococcota bacterium]
MTQNASSPKGPSSFGVSETEARTPLDRVLRQKLEGASWNQVRRMIETGKIKVDGSTVLDPTLLLRAGQLVEIVWNARRPDDRRLPSSTIVHVDSQVVVVEKPAGISTVPFESNERGTLDDLVARLLSAREGARRGPLGIVHRLDKDTSGLLVFARTLSAKRELKNQFRFHSVKRRYWALVQGAIESRTLSSRLVQDRGDGLRGSTENPTLGRSATTHVRVLERLRGATLAECRLETGRTHQIRIHLAEAGHPLLGERVYNRGFAGEVLQAPRVMLHAFELGFDHPTTRRPLLFNSEMPSDMQRVLAELRTLR